MTERTPIRTGEIDWEEEARNYLRRLPREHFMESTRQSTQRKIFDASMDLVQAERPDIHAFGELLVQWDRGRPRRVGQVVPDNMIVLYDGPIVANTSYVVHQQPAKPFWTLEYLSKHNQRKDYEDSFLKYEEELLVPYYLMFHPDEQEVTLFRHNGSKYVAQVPDARGRLSLPELEIEVELLDGWLRFWFRDRLLPLPAELQRELNETRKVLTATQLELDQTKQILSQQAQVLNERTRERDEALEELERLRQELAQLRGSAGA